MEAHDKITNRQQSFIEAQQMYFVATAPRSDDGHVNLSPKGLSSFTVIDERRVAYIDLGGSGIETHAHLTENGRICVMFCAFEGDPKILRLYGRGTAHPWGTPEFDALRDHFPAIEVPVRAIIDIEITRTQDSCGWAVPLYEYQSQRDRLLDHNAKRTQEEHFDRRLDSNSASIDGLPGLLRK